jgi:hypothetical protein
MGAAIMQLYVPAADAHIECGRSSFGDRLDSKVTARYAMTRLAT